MVGLYHRVHEIISSFRLLSLSKSDGHICLRTTMESPPGFWSFGWNEGVLCADNPLDNQLVEFLWKCCSPFETTHCRKSQCGCHWRLMTFKLVVRYSLSLLDSFGLIFISHISGDLLLSEDFSPRPWLRSWSESSPDQARFSTNHRRMTDGHRYLREGSMTRHYMMFGAQVWSHILYITFLLLLSDIFARMMFCPLKSWTVLTVQRMPGRKQPDGMWTEHRPAESYTGCGLLNKYSYALETLIIFCFLVFADITILDWEPHRSNHSAISKV